MAANRVEGGGEDKISGSKRIQRPQARGRSFGIPPNLFLIIRAVPSALTRKGRGKGLNSVMGVATLAAIAK